MNSELKDRAVAYLRTEEADNPDLEEIIKDFTELYDQMTQREELDPLNTLFVLQVLADAGCLDDEAISPKSNMCQYDEAFTIADMLEETNRCRNCVFTSCPNCGKSPV